MFTGFKDYDVYILQGGEALISLPYYLPFSPDFFLSKRLTNLGTTTHHSSKKGDKFTSTFVVHPFTWAGDTFLTLFWLF